MKGKLKHVLSGSLCFLIAGAIFAAENTAKAEQPGESLFKQHCAACHPAGGNIISPKKTLHKKDLKTNGIHTADDIVNIMRNPGPGMTKFDEKTVPDKDARLIADYIMKTF